MADTNIPIRDIHGNERSIDARTTADGDLRQVVIQGDGAFGYAAGTAPGTVNVPADARVKRVSVLAGSGGPATVAIAGGATITIPAGGSFDEQIPGEPAAGADVVIGGSITSYYVGWVS